MVFDWTREEKTLFNIKKIIAAAWRVNRHRLCVYCQILEKKQAETLPGRIGSAFLEKLEWLCSSEMDTETKIWPFLMRDIDCMLKIIQSHWNADRAAWITALSKLEAHPEKYFKTELGAAFILELKEKTGVGIPDKKQDQNKTVPAENVSLEIHMDSEIERKKIAAPLAERAKKAVIPVFACLSACFMSIWLYGQLIRNQSKWDLQQMKASEPKEAEAFIEKNTDIAPDAINHANKPADTGQPVKKIQIPDKQQPQSRPKKLPQYTEMSKEYPQLYGWLQIPDTQIDLPVMRAEGDRDFYLHHDFSGAESAEGALFVDARSSIYPQDDNTVVYGHNMKNGHIFGMLTMYGNKDYFQEHREIHFDTLYETGTYEAVAVLKTRILNENEQGFRYYQFFQYGNEKEFQECRDFVEDNCLFETGGALRYGDKILMLSTCEYSQENGRLVVVARKLYSHKR